MCLLMERDVCIGEISELNRELSLLEKWFHGEISGLDRCSCIREARLYQGGVLE